MILKDGTKFSDLDSAILMAAIVADGVWQELGVTTGVTLTSGTDGTHSPKSLHKPKNSPNGQGRAIDIRVWNLPDWKHNAGKATRILRNRLTADYDVVLEHKSDGAPSHVHCEYDPT